MVFWGGRRWWWSETPPYRWPNDSGLTDGRTPEEWCPTPDCWHSSWCLVRRPFLSAVASARHRQDSPVFDSGVECGPFWLPGRCGRRRANRLPERARVAILAAPGCLDAALPMRWGAVLRPIIRADCLSDWWPSPNPNLRQRAQTAPANTARRLSTSPRTGDLPGRANPVIKDSEQLTSVSPSFWKRKPRGMGKAELTMVTAQMRW